MNIYFGDEQENLSKSAFSSDVKGYKFNYACVITRFCPFQRAGNIGYHHSRALLTQSLMYSVYSFLDFYAQIV